MGILRKTLLILIALGLGLGIVWLLRQDSGYVLINISNTQIEMTVAVLAAGILVSFLLLYIAVRFVIGTLAMPGKLQDMRQNTMTRRAKDHLIKGLIQLNEGQWANAERTLIRYAHASDTPLLHYLGAARAAQAQDSPERRDNYLKSAHDSTPDAALAIELTQAELQLAHGQYEQALATLIHLREIAPKHRHVLRLLTRLHHDQNDWDAIVNLLPVLRRHHVYNDAELDRLTATTLERKLLNVQQSSDGNELQTVWQTVPRKLRDDETLVQTYAQQLHAAGQDAAAAELIRGVVRRRWDETLVLMYADLELPPRENGMAVAESWLKQHGDRPTVLLTAARLCAKNELWGRARSYLETASAKTSRRDIYEELGHLLERLGEADAAKDAFHKALGAADPGPNPTPAKSNSLSLPAPGVSTESAV